MLHHHPRSFRRVKMMNSISHPHCSSWGGSPFAGSGFDGRWQAGENLPLMCEFAGVSTADPLPAGQHSFTVGNHLLDFGNVCGVLSLSFGRDNRSINPLLAATAVAAVAQSRNSEVGDAGILQASSVAAFAGSSFHLSDSLSEFPPQGELPRGPQSLSAFRRSVNWWNEIFLENISGWQVSRIP
jgi:hypothetical protein